MFVWTLDTVILAVLLAFAGVCCLMYGLVSLVDKCIALFKGEK